MRNEDALATLMRQALEGDKAAYRDFLARAAVDIRAMARRRLPASAQADLEDVVQETLLAIHAKRHTWRPDRPIGPWLAAIARYKAIDAIRRRGARPAEDIADYEHLIAAPEVETVSAHDVQTVLDALPPGQRSVVSAITLEGRSIRETATGFGMSEVAVRVALHRGLAAIRSRMGRTT
ncbi:sigma-70 family RNA polymerase sigma factor [Mongoliimonas terrestris]|uniref:sigma-70 family RNA polymerase sigma factor n=1 Tax=Mongoliimonas terrestris TaxID=1709001 RepID=UPI000A7DBEE5|nr:sigma-70 family RNA polymerase sigma factor [Mongoliimonas terrestris]